MINKIIDKLKNPTNILFLIVVLIGLVLRVFGLNWGMPLLLHADEPVIAEQASYLITKNTKEPTYFGHPNHVSIYLSKFAYKTFYFSKYLGKDFKKTFEENRFEFYYLSRLIVAVLGTGCIVLAFLIGNCFGSLAGLAAAVMFAIFPLFVTHSHYATSDIPLVFFTLIVLFGCLKFFKTSKKIFLFLAVVGLALSVSEKYPGIINGLMIFLVIIKKYFSDIKKLLLVIRNLFITFLLSMLTVAPYLIIRFDKVIKSFINEARTEHLGIKVLGFWGNLKYYLDIYFDNTGVIMAIYFMIGLIFLVKNKKYEYLLLGIGAIYWVMLSKIPLHWERWGLPMYITPILITAIGLQAVINYVKKGDILVWLSGILACITIVCLFMRND